MSIKAGDQVTKPWPGGTMVSIGDTWFLVEPRLQKAIEDALSVASIEFAKVWPEYDGDQHRRAAKNIIKAYLDHEPK